MIRVEENCENNFDVKLTGLDIAIQDMMGMGMRFEGRKFQNWKALSTEIKC